MRCPSRAASSSPSTRAWRRPRSATSCATRVRACCSSTTRWRRWSSRSSEGSLDVVRIDDNGRSDDPYEQLIASGAPERPESWLEHEEEPISINYTSGTTGAPKGVVYTHRGAYLNALSRGDRGRAHARERLPLDAADVPLQRLVLPLGGDGGRGAARDRARRRSGPRLGADRAGGRDALQRRADGAHRRGRASLRAPAGAARDGARGGRAALADAVRAPRGAQLPRRARLRADRDVRADHREPRARRLRRSGCRRPRARARAPGPGLPDRRPRARGRRRRRRRAARRRDAWARS